MTNGEIVESFVVPVHPHTVLAPEQNEGWGRLRKAYDDAAKIRATRDELKQEKDQQEASKYHFKPKIISISIRIRIFCVVDIFASNSSAH